MKMTISTKQLVLARLVVALLALLPMLSACKKETDLQKESRQREEQYRAIDDGLIRDYFTRHQITKFTRLESGVYLVDTDTVTEGTGPTILPGKRVQVKYIGRFITPSRDNVIFDRSYGNQTLCECFEVTVDAGSVIKGWDEAIKNMKLGTHKLVFIPSYLAYGPAGSSPLIPGDEPLLFDMRITKVK
ncbi:FKBP-type peptidyl-prolyl cis-trans isomerase [Hymenobacter algoricola]|uniref:Peptidyl-prolyl cis-trans isomerase n=1 Tax=Hymenobacter algoricola TaxID=486267 RepID=A0ABP7N1Y7_9BACT